MMTFFHNKLRTVLMVASLIAFAQPGVICGQTYHFNSSVTGPQGTGGSAQEIPFSDISTFNPSGGAQYYGTEAILNYGAVSATLYYNSVAATMQMVGTVALVNCPANGAFSSTFNETQMVNGVAVPASISLNWTLANVNNGMLSFDTGVAQPVSGSTTSWSMNIQIPISGSYSLVTGGQAYNGAFNYTLGLNTLFNLQSATQTKLTFYQDTVPDAQFLNVSLGQTNAANGVQLNLHAKDHQDGSTYQSWHLDGVQAQVPEPSSLALLISGCAGLALLYRRRRA